MSKTGQQSQGGSGKPNFKPYRKGSSKKGAARRKERAGKQWAAGEKKKDKLREERQKSDRW